MKSPIAFEFHKALFSEKEEKALADYYSDIKKKLHQNDTSFEYSFTPEDCYIYLIAHEYKHYNYGGTGLRSLVDIYVYLREWKDMLLILQHRHFVDAFSDMQIGQMNEFHMSLYTFLALQFSVYRCILLKDLFVQNMILPRCVHLREEHHEYLLTE